MYPGGLQVGCGRRYFHRAQIQWQPKIDLAVDTHDHSELNGSNLFPIVLLNPPTVGVGGSYSGWYGSQVGWY